MVARARTGGTAMAGTRRMRLVGVLRADGAAVRAVEAELAVEADGSWRIRWADLDGSERVVADGSEQTVGWLLRRIVGEVAIAAEDALPEVRTLLPPDVLRQLAG